MSEGRSTQAKVNVLSWASIALWILFAILFFVFGQRGLAYLAVALTVPLYLGVILARCRKCGLHVTHEADGSWSHRGVLPKVNPQCRRCGADIP